MQNTLDMAQALIKKPSITPDDAGCQDMIAQWLAPYQFHIQPMNFSKVKNLWAYHGQQGPCVTFAGHTDVVPAGDTPWQYPAFAAQIADGYLYGRGAADMKGNLAAMLNAGMRFIKEYPNHKGTLAFLITSDEEGDAIDGTRKVIEQLNKEKVKIDYCVVGEASSQNCVGDTIKIGRRGSLHGHLTLQGQQGHIAYPESAINPIHPVGHLIKSLSEQTWGQADNHFPATSFQISNIHAGAGIYNMIPNELTLDFNFRYHPNDSVQKLQKIVTKIIEQQALTYILKWHQSAQPFFTPPSTLLVKTTTQAIHDITQLTPQFSTNGGTSDGRFISPTGAEVVELGVCNATIHQTDERVKITELEKLEKIYYRILELLLT